MDNKNPTLSIILTAYNIEKYIKECIDSILVQDYADYELIIIDDGSDDFTGKFCDEYRRTRGVDVRVVHTENKGVSAARNTGIELARGEYIFFIDGDDVMIRRQLKKIMLSVTSGNAVVTCFHLDAFNNETGDEIDLGYGYNENIIKFGTKPQIVNELLRHEAVPWSPEVSIIRADFLKEKGIKFRDEAYGAEDCMFFLDVVKVCASFAYIPMSLTRYRMNRKGSIMNTPNLRKLKVRAVVYGKWIEYADELISFSEGSSTGAVGGDIKARMGNAFFYNMLQIYDSYAGAEFFDIINTHKDILKYAVGMKKKLLYMLIKTIGAKSAMKIALFKKL